MIHRQRRGFLGLDIFGSEEPDGRDAGSSTDGQQDRQDNRGGRDADDHDNESSSSAETSEGDSDSEDRNNSDSVVEKLRKRISAADRTSADLLKKLKAYEDKDRSEAEIATNAAKEAEELNAKLSRDNQSLRIEIEVDRAKVQWQNPAAVSKFLDPEDFMDDGQIDESALRKAIKKVATDHPYLVKPENDKDTPGTPSGGRVGSKKNGNQGNTNTSESLRARYPALRN